MGAYWGSPFSGLRHVGRTVINRPHLRHLVCENLPNAQSASPAQSPMDPKILWGTEASPAQTTGHSLDRVVAGEGDEAPEGQ